VTSIYANVTQASRARLRDFGDTILIAAISGDARPAKGGAPRVPRTSAHPPKLAKGQYRSSSFVMDFEAPLPGKTCAGGERREANMVYELFVTREGAEERRTLILCNDDDEAVSAAKSWARALRIPPDNDAVLRVSMTDGKYMVFAQKDFQ
jgi:hypothetical protein